MKRFSIEITGEGKSNLDLEGKVILGSDTWFDFIELAKRLDLWDSILFRVEITCDRCGSFLIDSSDFYFLMTELKEFIDRQDMETEFSRWEKVYNILDGIEEALDEAWYSIYDNGGSQYNEMAIIFDNECSCNEFFVGKAEDQESGEPIDDNSTVTKVSKWIGPVKRKIR